MIPGAAKAQRAPGIAKEIFGSPGVLRRLRG